MHCPSGALPKVCQQGKIYQQRYVRGIPKTGVEVVGNTEQTGTITEFKPDPGVFETVEFSYETISHRLRELAFLNKGLEIRVEMNDRAQARFSL